MRKTRWLPGARALIDAAAMLAGVIIAYNYRFHIDRIPIPGSEPPAFGYYLAAAPIVTVIFIVTFAASGVYRIRRGRPLLDELFSIIGAAALAGVVTLALMSIYRGFSYSRLVLLYAVIVALVLITLGRILLRQILTVQQRRGIGTDRVLVVGTGAGSELLLHRMTMFPEFGYTVVGVLDDRLDPGAPFAGSRVVGRIGELPVQVRAHNVDQVFLALPGASHDELLHLIKTCDDLQVDFRMLPDVFEIITTRVSADMVDGIPLVGVRRSQVEGLGLVTKRAFDLIVGLLLILVLSPIWLLLGLAIRLSGPGPVFYRQERVGQGGRIFTLIKFRSMIPDAEADTGPIFASPDDERRTVLGRFMRRFSLDELPQLINIIRGDMSLVGPRPERPYFVERFGAEIPRYLERHQVRPGVTGWAQVNDLRGSTSIADRTIYDIYYIENWSLSFDIKILLLTIGRVFLHSHAY
ncbi:MAG TPA: undecaprenyl-phosphate glucose phosphotransferase [Candidatus Dormibacteraeota bacterium]|nr:undecaprenyl-phosphate glucose phosphotransferase [Candidatus Dormibacteraeota bacterium]